MLTKEEWKMTFDFLSKNPFDNNENYFSKYGFLPIEDDEKREKYVKIQKFLSKFLRGGIGKHIQPEKNASSHEFQSKLLLLPTEDIIKILSLNPTISYFLDIKIVTKIISTHPTESWIWFSLTFFEEIGKIDMSQYGTIFGSLQQVGKFFSITNVSNENIINLLNNIGLQDVLGLGSDYIEINNFLELLHKAKIDFWKWLIDSRKRIMYFGFKTIETEISKNVKLRKKILEDKQDLYQESKEIYLNELKQSDNYHEAYFELSIPEIPIDIDFHPLLLLLTPGIFTNINSIADKLSRNFSTSILDDDSDIPPSYITNYSLWCIQKYQIYNYFLSQAYKKQTNKIYLNEPAREIDYYLFDFLDYYKFGGKENRFICGYISLNIYRWVCLQVLGEEEFKKIFNIIYSFIIFF